MVARKADMREGLVIVLTAVHRFYSTPIDLRADVDLLLVRSTGTPVTFDSGTVTHMLGKSVFDEMRSKEERAFLDRSQLGWTAWASKNGSGLVLIPRAEARMPSVANTKAQYATRPWGPRSPSVNRVLRVSMGAMSALLAVLLVVYLLTIWQIWIP